MVIYISLATFQSNQPFMPMSPMARYFNIGSATRGLKKRLYFYQRPGVTQQTSIRINALIKEELAAGRKVWVIAAFPDPTGWNGLPVDTVTGLEAGLLRRLAPPWNKRGV